MKKALTFLAIAILMLSLSLALVGCQQPEGEIPGGDNAENAPSTVADKLSDFEYTGTEGNYTVTGIKNKSVQKIIIPSGVTGIGDGAFAGCTDLENINIPDSVTAIGDYAFFGCYDLEGVEIPNSVVSIGSSAFQNCIGLEKISIPFIGASKDATENAFLPYLFGGPCLGSGNDELYVPSTLKEVVITGGSSIGSSAFEDCKNLTSITIPDSVTSIGSSAFSGCTGLTSITIPDTVTSIGSSAFSGCTGLEKITIPFIGAAKGGESNTYFGYMFGASDYHYNKTYLPEGLKEVIITGGSSIGSSAFYNCTGLTSVTIPDSVTSIGGAAFRGCAGLTSITIPNSVTSIGVNAFNGCTSLTSATIGSGVISSRFDYVFPGCTSLTSITIADGVTSIGSSAFEGCTGLTSVTIPDSVTTIGEYAFRGCTGLTNINVDENNTVYKSIGGNLYSKDGKTLVRYATGKSDKHFAIPDSVTSIGSSAFYNCTGLTSVIIPDSVTSIGSYAFEGCARLTSITIPDSITSIGGYAFDGCTALAVINYCGTKEQWREISKHYDWDDNTGDYTIIYNYEGE